MKILFKIFKIIIYTVLILVIIFNLISMLSMKFSNSEYPIIFGYTYFNVVSGSMEPTIDIGDDIVIKLTKDVSENDVITFVEDGAFVTHRIVRIDGENIITKGDNNDSEDDPKTIDAVVGKLVLVIPLLGKIRYTITNVYFVIVLILVYIIYLFVSNSSNKKAENIKTEDETEVVNDIENIETIIEETQFENVKIGKPRKIKRKGAKPKRVKQRNKKGKHS